MDRLKSMGSGEAEEGAAGWISNKQGKKKQEGEEAREEGWHELAANIIVEL